MAMFNDDGVNKCSLCYLTYNENDLEQKEFLDKCEEDIAIASFAFKA